MLRSLLCVLAAACGRHQGMRRVQEILHFLSRFVYDIETL